ncbi:twin-arginine translocation pathway signal [Bradyrhizobium sp. CCGUVB1N3]|uniref:twin-arginine translocation pathway signal n=1 Tax=Bradyrhizobium sp. CCGUVB1N3 TaxID=2949629 RepID=UPI0020B2A399|nr:twin-arginine translocation pathway signal [Bradyrhizobium sp. CCGUVB1N3]MCP3477476.1 twin-arginine translocation pathway signal [Bradyrhizobium sp. CCGUVB1N3]
MSVSILNRCRPALALVVLLALGSGLGGCASVGETISPAFVDPGKYDLWDCKQLAPERKSLANRLVDLERLMAKAETGTGGAVVSELAYRNDYISIRAQQKLLEENWRRNKCRESDMVPTPPPASPVPPTAAKPVAKPVPGSKSSSAAH